MIPSSKPITLSLSDFGKTLTHGWKRFLAIGLLSGSLFFVYFLTREVRYTAEGTFKGTTSNSASTLTKALGLVAKEEQYSPSDDPLVFLQSYPVMEDVVRSLDLQGCLSKKTNGIFLSKIWKNLKTENAFHRLRRDKLHSTILKKNLLVPLQPILPDRAELIRCHQIDFPLEVAKQLRIVFKDDTHFQVFENQSLLGKGSLDRSFRWKGGSFTLEKRGARSLRKRHYDLTLIPLSSAVNSLTETIKVQRDCKSPSIFHILYTHSDRHLAAAIVNATMDSFQKYLRNEGERKITKQLHYLHTRQQEILAGLDSVMEKHRTYLQSHLDSSDILTLEKELEFIVIKQIEGKKELALIQWEMGQISQSLFGKCDFPKSLLKERSVQTDSLTEGNVKTLLSQHQHSLDQLRLEKERYDYCLLKLQEPSFDSSSLSKIIADPILNARFEKIHTLHRNIIDKKNWTSKERDLFEEELTTEKTFLLAHLGNLKQGVVIQENTLSERVRSLQEILLCLLWEREQSVRSTLDQMMRQATHFPKKWLVEQKIALHTKLQTEMIEGISKVIEAKNIDYHIDFISSTPLMLASAPSLPHHPHLLWGFMNGFWIGAFLSLGVFFAREIYLGPRASYHNLKNGGYWVGGLYTSNLDLETVRRTIHQLEESDSVVSLVTTVSSSFCDIFTSLLCNRQERVLAIDLRIPTKKGLLNFLTGELEQPPIIQEVGRDVLYLGESLLGKVELLGSIAFKRLMEKFKRDYDRIVLISNASSQSVEVALLSKIGDKMIYGIGNERCRDIENLSKSVLFVIHPYCPPLRTLSEIQPLLNRLYAQTRSLVHD